MKNIAQTNVTIIGVDDFGLAIAKSLSSRGASVTLTGRDYQQVTTNITELSLNVKAQPTLNAVIDADLILIAAPDSEITSLCKLLSINFKKGAVVAHFSSALDSRALAPAQRKPGISVCSLFPLGVYSGLEETMKTFGNQFHRTYLYGEGDALALSLSDYVFKELGFFPVEISQEAKPKLHAASVIARDYLAVLFHLSMDTAESAGIDRDTFGDSLQPLVEGALLKINAKDTLQTMTGPITSGDVETLEKHLSVLEDVSSSLYMTYANMGKQALSLAMKNSNMDRATILEIHKVLNQAIRKGS